MNPHMELVQLIDAAQRRGDGARPDKWVQINIPHALCRELKGVPTKLVGLQGVEMELRVLADVHAMTGDMAASTALASFAQRIRVVLAALQWS